MSEDESDPVVGHMHGGEISVSMDRNMCDEEVINTESGKMGLFSGIFMGVLFGIALMAGWARMMKYRSAKRIAKV